MKSSERRKARHITVFLDVDGVLNSYPVTGWRFTQEGRKKAHAWNYELHFRPKIIKMLEQLVADRDADLVWLSTWSHLCRTEIEPKLGFKRSYPIIPMPDSTFNRYADDPEHWWKAIAVEQWLAENPGKRAVWIDDDLVYPKTVDHFRETYRDRVLMVVPEFATGLTEEHLQRIQEFSYPRPSDSAPALATDYEVAPSGRGQARSDALDMLPAGEHAQDADLTIKHAAAGPDIEKIAPAGDTRDEDVNNAQMPGTSGEAPGSQSRSGK